MSKLEEVVDKNFHHAALRNTDSELESIDDVSNIAPYIFIASWENAVDMECLRFKNIKHVLSVIESKKSEATTAAMARLGIAHEHMPIENLPTTDLGPWLAASNAYIKRAVDAKRNVLVHCAQGVSTAPAIVAHHLLRQFYTRARPQKNMLELLITKMRERRACIDINFGFIEQLEDVEATLSGRAVVAAASLSTRRNAALRHQLNTSFRDNVVAARQQAETLWPTEQRSRRY